MPYEKDFFRAFAGDKKKFDKAVLINVFSDDVWIIGFLTDAEMDKFEMGAEHVSVYVPQAYNFAGQLYILPRYKVKKISHLTSGDAMKYAVMAGAVTGGGLTVIANAPNPAGQSILAKYFPHGVSPVWLFLGAFIPTVIATLFFMLFK